MHAGDLDVLICARPESALLDGVSVEPIVRDRMGLFVSCRHPLARRRCLAAQDLLPFSFILPPVGSITRNLLDETFVAATGRRPQGAVETSSYSLISKLLLSSNQISFRSEEHTSELQSLMRRSYAVFCLNKKKQAQTSH